MPESQTPSGEKVVGVLGGMGPEATVEFMRRLVAATPARDDADHLRVLVDNNPKVPSRLAAIVDGDGEDPAPVLCAMARGLVGQGAEILAMPCVTAHYYLPQIARSVDVPVLDMVKLSIEALPTFETKPGRVGLLASPAVRIVGLYDVALRGAGLDVVMPDADDETVVLETIRAVKAGRLSPSLMQRYIEVGMNLIDAGADAILIACTELSTVEAPDDWACPVVDALDALACATIAKARPPAPTGKPS